MAAIRCYGHGALDVAAAAAVLRLMVLAQHAACFLDEPGLCAQQTELLSFCKGVMTGRSGKKALKPAIECAISFGTSLDNACLKK